MQQKEKNDCGLNIIFETKVTEFNKDRYESGEIVKVHVKPYTGIATIIQSILRYYDRVESKDRFTAEELTEHLVQPDPDDPKGFESSYSGNNNKTKIPARISRHAGNIQAIIKTLIYLELVEDISDCQKQEKIYRFTKLGKMIGALLLYKNNKAKNANKNLDRIVDFYDSMNHSSAKFFSIFLRKCINTRVFDQVVTSLITLLETSSPEKVISLKQIKNINPLLTKSSWPILEESFIEFEKKESSRYDILFYNSKLILESIHESKSANFKSFEELRILARMEPFVVTIEGYCKKCNMFTPYITGLIQYFRSYANSTLANSHNHLNVKCPNPVCNNGFLDFEFVTYTKSIKEVPNVKVRRGEKFYVNLDGNQLDDIGTIFERTQEGKYSKNSKRSQIILEFLYDNPDRFFKTRDIFNKVSEVDPTTFAKKKKGSLDFISPECYYYQFESYLNHFVFSGIVSCRKTKGYKTSGLVKEYSITPFGKVFALWAKAKSTTGDKEACYEEMYQKSRLAFDEPPISSLDKFCEEYFYKCRENGFFKYILGFIEEYITTDRTPMHVYSFVDLLTEVILSRIYSIEVNDEENKLINTELWWFWITSYTTLDDKDASLFLNHIRLHITKRIEKTVHDEYKYEVERFKQRDLCNFITIEAVCLYCPYEFVYLTIPVTKYVEYLYDIPAEKILPEDIIPLNIVTADPVCTKCKGNNLKFLIV